MLPPAADPTLPTPPTPHLDRRGRVILLLSGIAPAMLFLSAVVVAWLGAEFFRLHPTPDPIGRASTTFSASTLCFTLSGVSAIFVMLAFAGWYRAAFEDGGEADRIAANWAGTTFVLVGLPYFIFGLLYNDLLGGRLLLWGSLLSFVVGGAFFARPLLGKRKPTPAPRDTR